MYVFLVFLHIFFILCLLSSYFRQTPPPSMTPILTCLLVFFANQHLIQLIAQISSLCALSLSISACLPLSRSLPLFVCLSISQTRAVLSIRSLTQHLMKQYKRKMHQRSSNSCGYERYNIIITVMLPRNTI